LLRFDVHAKEHKPLLVDCQAENRCLTIGGFIPFSRRNLRCGYGYSFSEKLYKILFQPVDTVNPGD